MDSKSIINLSAWHCLGLKMGRGAGCGPIIGAVQIAKGCRDPVADGTVGKVRVDCGKLDAGRDIRSGRIHTVHTDRQ